MIQIRKRVMVIPKIERYIGSVGDSNSEYRTFRINRYTETQIDIADLSFSLVLKNENSERKEIVLDKEVGRHFIDLTWRIIASDITTDGTLLAQVKGYDISGLIRWNSYTGALYVMDSIGEVEIGENLSEYERAIASLEMVKQDILDSQIESTEVDDDGYLIITFANGRSDRFYVKGDPASQDAIKQAVEELGIDLDKLIEQANSATDMAQAAADSAMLAAERAEQAARGDKGSETILIEKTMWGSTPPYRLEIQNDTLRGMTSSDFITTVNIHEDATETEVKELKKSLGFIDLIEITSLGARFTCYTKKPTVDMGIYFREV